MKKAENTRKKLTLSRQTLRRLSAPELAHIAGGQPVNVYDEPGVTHSCIACTDTKIEG